MSLSILSHVAGLHKELESFKSFGTPKVIELAQKYYVRCLG